MLKKLEGFLRFFVAYLLLLVGSEAVPNQNPKLPNSSPLNYKKVKRSMNI